jgi:hypothetical protein
MRDVISDHVRIMGRDAPTASEGPSGERAAISAVVQNCFAGNCFGHNLSTTTTDYSAFS